MSAAAPIETETAAPAIDLIGETLLPDSSGALYWPAAGTVIVADLHLEKGTSYGPRGITLPPYDTAATLAALGAVLARLRPERVICLGDSFHDGGAGERIDPTDRAVLAALAASHRWFWVAGNHDPQPLALGGRVVGELAIGRLIFRHEAEFGAADGEVSGHYHPKSGYRARGRSVVGRCFVGDGRRLILPAFGAYAGGLDVFDPAVRRLFPGGFDIHLIARGRVTRLPRG
jgi:DNA ligase-associated metallophosphoesterase